MADIGEFMSFAHGELIGKPPNYQEPVQWLAQ